MILIIQANMEINFSNTSIVDDNTGFKGHKSADVDELIEYLQTKIEKPENIEKIRF